MAAYEERCLYATTTEMSSGTARNAPKGPHIQAQNAIDKKTRNGFRVRRCPMIVGVMNCPSTVVTRIQRIGATKASVRLGKLKKANYKQRGHYYGWTKVGNKTQRACEHTPKKWIR